MTCRWNHNLLLKDRVSHGNNISVRMNPHIIRMVSNGRQHQQSRQQSRDRLVTVTCISVSRGAFLRVSLQATG